MTASDINVDIAEVCGWYRSKIISGWWAHQSHLTAECVPNYEGSLDAMHAAEKVLEVMGLCVEYVNCIERGRLSRYGVCHATAPQRAEAFLRTLGLWKG